MLMNETVINTGFVLRKCDVDEIFFRCKEKLLNQATGEKQFSRTIHQSQNSDNFFGESNARYQNNSFTNNRSENYSKPRPPGSQFVPSAAYARPNADNRRNIDNNRLVLYLLINIICQIFSSIPQTK